MTHFGGAGGGDEISGSEQRWKWGMRGRTRELSIVVGRNVTAIEYLNSLWLKGGKGVDKDQSTRTNKLRED